MKTLLRLTSVPALAFSLSALAAVPQRYFLDLGGGEGMDSHLHWTFASPVEIDMNDLNAGACKDIGSAGSGDHRLNPGLSNSSIGGPNPAAGSCGLTSAQVR